MAAPIFVLIKLGGSLITDKRRPGSVRRSVLRRLAGEVAEARRTAGTPALILGHGSGAFGHVAAKRHGLGRGQPATAPGVAATQDAARLLHAEVIAALLGAGATPFSLAPSSLITAAGGRPVTLHAAPLLGALDLDLLPVVFGDVVIDRDLGASICSTETLFTFLAARLARRGWRCERVLWLGETEGIYDVAGELVRRVTRRNLAAVRRAVGKAAGVDVTGGMRHRLAAASSLARRGVESWILDGRVPGRLAAALRGDRVPATRIQP